MGIMGQIIIIEPNQSLCDLISINLKAYLGAEVIPRESGQDATALLSILPSVQLIICHNRVAEEFTAKVVDQFLTDQSLDIPMIILGKSNINFFSNHLVIENPENWEEIIKQAAKILGFKEDALSRQVRPDYVPIELFYFYEIENTCCDVFIRIKKGESDFQFLKRIHAGDTFSKEMIQKYEDQGLKYFYIPKEMQTNFTNSVSDQLVKKLGLFDQRTDDSDQLEEFIKSLDRSFEIAHKEIQKFGFSSATIQLCDTVIEGMLKTVHGSQEMSPLLRKVLNAKAKYLYLHGHLSMIIAIETLRTLKKDTQSNISLIAYACFFKDIALCEKPELAHISTQNELDESNLDSDDWSLVMGHAFEGAKTIRNHSESPISADTLILTHHGSLDGRGFYSKDQDDLSELNIYQQIFILSCEFAKEILRFKEEGGKPTPILPILKKHFDNPTLEAIFGAMEKGMVAK